jgi:hypothetical protein
MLPTIGNPPPERPPPYTEPCPSTGRLGSTLQLERPEALRTGYLRAADAAPAEVSEKAIVARPANATGAAMMERRLGHVPKGSV